MKAEIFDDANLHLKHRLLSSPTEFKQKTLNTLAHQINEM